jgi:hypothetical protein
MMVKCAECSAGAPAREKLRARNEVRWKEPAR